MDNEQIDNILEGNPRTRRIYKGCFPCDGLPDPLSINYPAIFIVNMDPSGFDGSHWVALYANGLGRELIYFDSLHLPTNIMINNDFLIHFPKVIRNKETFQSFNKNSCPYYCILFTYFLSLGYSFSYFLQVLEDSIYPDLFVKNICNNMIE